MSRSRATQSPWTCVQGSEQVLRVRITGTQVHGATRLRDRIRQSADLCEPARVEEVGDRIPGIESLRGAEMLLGFWQLSERAFEDRDVHVEVRVLRHERQRAAEVLIGCPVVALAHSYPAVRHQSAA